MMPRERLRKRSRENEHGFYESARILSQLNLSKSEFEKMKSLPDQELAVWYNDKVIYPDKVRLNCYYYQHYSFVKDIQMIFATVLGKKMMYAGEEI